MNQCDGCRAGKIRVVSVGGEWYESVKGEIHIMGQYFIGTDGLVIARGYPDLMQCTRRLYEVQDERVETRERSIPTA